MSDWHIGGGVFCGIGMWELGYKYLGFQPSLGFGLVCLAIGVFLMTR
jgi:hypothetical protein